MYAYMTKVISVSDDAYSALFSLKNEGESFTDVITHLAKGASKKAVSSFAGAWSGDKKGMDSIFKGVRKERENFGLREAKL